LKKGVEFFWGQNFTIINAIMGQIFPLLRGHIAAGKRIHLILKLGELCSQRRQKGRPIGAEIILGDCKAQFVNTSHS
jgi:hypothetical protein